MEKISYSINANCLNACSTPINTTGSVYPVGTIFALNGPQPANSFPLYIQLI